MKTDNAQQVWTDYYQRKKVQRLEEADALWERMRLAGVRADTDLVVDFLMFGTSREAVEALASQLSENYQVEVSEDARPGYWLANATTRLYAIALADGQLNAWVNFVADVAQSHACVFSTWKMEAPALGQSFLSEQFESAS